MGSNGKACDSACSAPGLDCRRKTFVHRELPIYICRLHLDVKRPRFLADERDIVTRAFAVDNHLDHAAADRASQHQLEPAFTRLRLVARLPRKSKVSVRGERVRFHIAAAGPGPGALPYDCLLRGFGWRLRTRRKEKKSAEGRAQTAGRGQRAFHALCPSALCPFP